MNNEMDDESLDHLLDAILNWPPELTWPPEFYELAWRQRLPPFGLGKECGLCGSGLTSVEWKMTEGLCYRCWRRLCWGREDSDAIWMTHIPEENLPDEVRAIRAVARREKERYRKLKAAIQALRQKYGDRYITNAWREDQPLPDDSYLLEILGALFRGSNASQWGTKTLRGVFRKLTRKQLRALFLYHCFGLTEEEVGAIEGIKKSAVSRRLQRASDTLEKAVRRISPGVQRWPWHLEHDSCK